MNNLEWNVYIINSNTNKATTYNIFKHHRFNEAIKTIRKDDERFEDKVKNELMYYFWSKFEWEIDIIPLIGRTEGCATKVDVYSQVMLNFDKFVKYIKENK